MNSYVALISFFMVFTLAACDSDSRIGVPSEVGTVASAANVVYFPDGGGIEISKPFVAEKEGAGWKYKEFIFDSDRVALSTALKAAMLQQGYEEQGDIDLQGFEYALSFAKKDSHRKVNYRISAFKALTGKKLLVRLSWNT